MTPLRLRSGPDGPPKPARRSVVTLGALKRAYKALFGRFKDGLTVAANAVVANLPDCLVGAVNERPIEPGEWQQITPWGKFPNSQGAQNLTRQAGEAMVVAFNTLAGRLKNAWRGIPIYVGHPDVSPKEYPDKRRYGKIEALEARPDGLYAKPAWNSLGQENLDQGFYIYPSGVWSCVKERDGSITPKELLSVGLTNWPNIETSKPWAKNEGEAPEDRDQRAEPSRPPQPVFETFYGFPPR